MEAKRERWADLLERVKAEGFTDELGRYEMERSYLQEVNTNAVHAFELVAVTIGYRRGLGGILKDMEQNTIGGGESRKAEEMRKRVEAELERANKQLDLRLEERADAEEEETRAHQVVGIALQALIDAILWKRDRLAGSGGDSEQIERLSQLQYELRNERK